MNEKKKHTLCITSTVWHFFYSNSGSFHHKHPYLILTTLLTILCQSLIDNLDKMTRMATTAGPDMAIDKVYMDVFAKNWKRVDNLWNQNRKNGQNKIC